MTASAALAVVLFTGGGLLWMSPGVERRRLAALGNRRHARALPAGAMRYPRYVAAVLLGAATGAIVGGTPTAVVFAGLAATSLGLARQRARAARRRRHAVLSAGVAPCADLLAASLAAGATAEEALACVAPTTELPLRECLTSVAAALRAGYDPAQAWAPARDLPALAPIARAFVRSARSGAPLAATVATVAQEQRRVRRWQAEAAARRAGVWAVAPLVCCFLPAFILVGVVPVVLGMAAEVVTLR